MSIYPAALATHLEGEATTVCHCWRLTRRDGVIKGFTDHDRRLTVDGDAFQPLTGFSATEARDTLGLAVDTVDVEGALSSDDIGEADIAAGLYDDAMVETLLVNWAEPAQFARLRSATIGKITRRDNAFVAELKSRMHGWTRSTAGWPRANATPNWAIIAAASRSVRPGFSAAGTVASVSTPERYHGLRVERLCAAGSPGHGIEWTSGAAGGRGSFAIARTCERRGRRRTVACSRAKALPGAGDAS